MTTTTDLASPPDEALSPIHESTRGEPATQLTMLADWIRQHGVEKAELIEASASGHDLCLHITEEAARRLFPGKRLKLSGKHAYWRADGILFAFITESDPPPQEMTL